MFRKSVFVFLLFALSTAPAQKLHPGFDAREYRDLLALSVKNFYPEQTKNIPLPAKFERKYRSPSIGLDNVWELWTSADNIAVISTRGTSADPKSMLANAYAAMVPATGKLTLEKDHVFDYSLSDHPKAAVHVGWLIATAFLSKDMLPHIRSLHAGGIKEFYLTGHSQGGAITILLTSYFAALQRRGILPPDIRFKTYSSAAPKVGNQYFAYDYSVLTQNGWAYNVINADDWVPQTFLTVQETADFPDINIFTTVEEQIEKQSFFKRLLAKGIYNDVNSVSRRTQQKYQQVFGDLVSEQIRKKLPGFISPKYYPSGNYVQSGNCFVLMGDEAYKNLFPDDKTKLMQHHQSDAYYFLINGLIKNQIPQVD